MTATLSVILLPVGYRTVVVWRKLAGVAGARKKGPKSNLHQHCEWTSSKRAPLGCPRQQVARWFCQRKANDVYLAFIRPVQDEEKRIVPIVPEKTETGCDVEKAYHKDMPEEIKVVLQKYKDIFPTDLPPELPPIRKGHEFKIELEDDAPPIHRPIYKLSPLELEEAKKQFSTCSSTATSDRRFPHMEHRCYLQRIRMAVFNFVSITAGSIKRRSRTGIRSLFLRNCLIFWGAPQFIAASIFDPGIGRYR